jgi:DNA topoisomerase-1
VPRATSAQRKEHDFRGEVLDPKAEARAAGLRYSSPNEPGLHRHRTRGGFRYTEADGRPVRNRRTLDRIKSLVIPPAWNDIWICATSTGHLQAVGRDARGRRQYRYHPEWRRVRDETKYDRTVAFGNALPAIRRRVNSDLAKPGLPRERVLAAVVRLLEATMIRIGNGEYAKTNGSYGLTTLRDRHVQFEGSRVIFAFVGKSGKKHAVDIADRRLAGVIKRCRDIPGYNLFQYLGDDGQRQSITSTDVNAYLREISGGDFTAKDFRTWGGTLLAMTALSEIGPFETETQAKRNINEAVSFVAERLGNTVATCRKCYVHPEVLTAYSDGEFAHPVTTPRRRGLDPDEARVLALLESRRAA